MSLASFQFLTFLTVVFALWKFAFLSSESRRNFLLVASYVFYCSWDALFAVLLGAVTVVQWLIGRQIHSSSGTTRRKMWLGFSVVAGVGCLGYFKYFGFFTDGLSSLLQNAGLGSIAGLANIAAPIGISFYTFQSLTYTIDIYRRATEPTPKLRDFGLFLSFFPHVTAGPIARARLLIPQIEADQGCRVGLDALAVGLIARGFVKKIAIADVLAAQFVTPAFANPDQWSPWFLLAAVVAYSFQIYMDLSGYTDIARGAARCFGYDLQLNFDRPYLARSVSNFWQRWHMSMSGFFREYLYWSIGGSKRGNVYLNLMVTFVAIGLWHGAGWNFVLYGLLHGGVVCLERVRRQRRRLRGAGINEDSILSIVTGITYTFLFVAFARILFVETDLLGAWQFMHSMVLGQGGGAAAGLQGYATLAVAALLHATPTGWQIKVGSRFMGLHPAMQGGLISGLVYCLIALAAESRPFVYFQF